MKFARKLEEWEIMSIGCVWVCVCVWSKRQLRLKFHSGNLSMQVVKKKKNLPS